MNPVVPRTFGVESCGDYDARSQEHGSGVMGAEHFRSGFRLQNRRPDEYPLECTGGCIQRGGKTGQLSSEGVAMRLRGKQAEFARPAIYLHAQEDGSRTDAENGHSLSDMFTDGSIQPVQVEEACHDGALPSGEYEGVQTLQILWPADLS